ncbi:MAG TPA: hypothetical protein VF381_07355 [Thermoanaerobaculia bacterium]
MTARAKGFVVGFAAASALFVCGAFVWGGLHDAMVRSKSKGFLAEGSVIDEAILRYREHHSAYPASKDVVLHSLPRNDGDFDYFSNGTEYTLICPSLIGAARWEPYVFRNGRLVAWPSYVDEEVKRRLATPPGGGGTV